MRGNWSPLNISTRRLVPSRVRKTTSPGRPSVTAPMSWRLIHFRRLGGDGDDGAAVALLEQHGFLQGVGVALVDDEPQELGVQRFPVRGDLELLDDVGHHLQQDHNVHGWTSRASASSSMTSRTTIFLSWPSTFRASSKREIS